MTTIFLLLGPLVLLAFAFEPAYRKFVQARWERQSPNKRATSYRDAHLLPAASPPRPVAVPKGFNQCVLCGEYKGKAKVEGKIWVVTCLCDGMLCRKCGVTRIHSPVSNYFDKDTGKCWHIPYFGSTVCDRCDTSRSLFQDEDITDEEWTTAHYQRQARRKL
jgi:hypothetical protein